MDSNDYSPRAEMARRLVSTISGLVDSDSDRLGVLSDKSRVGELFMNVNGQDPWEQHITSIKHDFGCDAADTAKLHIHMLCPRLNSLRRLNLFDMNGVWRIRWNGNCAHLGDVRSHRSKKGMPLYHR